MRIRCMPVTNPTVKPVSRIVSKPLGAVTVVLFSLVLAISAGAYNTDTHRAITTVAARSPFCTLASVNDQNFLWVYLHMPDGLDTPAQDADGSSQSLVQWLAFGAEEEDTLIEIRPAWHFYDPLSNQGLSDPAWVSYFGLGPMPSALEWAWDGAADNLFLGGNDWDWQVARNYQLLWLTDPDPQNRETYEARTFRAIGHVVHLLQDMAQPQHTRNDAHYPTSKPGGQGAPYEDFCSQFYKTPDQIQQLPAEAPPYDSLGNSLLTMAATPDWDPLNRIPAQFRAFWDTEQYQGQNPAGLNIASLGLAEYSNAFFVTDDTMFTGESAMLLRNPLTGAVFTCSFTSDPAVDPRHKYPYPKLANTTFTAMFPPPSRFSIQRLGQSIFETPTIPTADLRSPSIPSLFSLRMPVGSAPAQIGLTGINYQAHARKLLPKAVSYSTGLLNYFFRGKLSYTIHTVFTVSGTQHEFTITNLSGDEFTGGEWHLYQDGAHGQRTPIQPIEGSIPYNGRLGRGETLTFHLPDSVPTSGLTLVFQGTIGGEHGAVAGVYIVDTRGV